MVSARLVPTLLQTVCWFVSGIFATGAFWYFLSQKNAFATLWSAFAAIVFALLAIAIAIHIHITQPSFTTVPPSSGVKPSLRVAFNGNEMEYHNTGSLPFRLIGGVIDGRTDHTPTPVLVVAGAHVQTHGAAADLGARASKVLLTDGETRIPYDVYVRCEAGETYVYRCAIIARRLGDTFQFGVQANDVIKASTPLPDFSIPGTLVVKP